MAMLSAIGAVREQAGLLDHVADAPAQLVRPAPCGRRRRRSRCAPPVGSSSRLIIRSVVVLPQPDGPTRAISSPSGMSRLRSVTAGRPDAEALLDVVEPDRRGGLVRHDGSPLRTANRHSPGAPPGWPFPAPLGLALMALNLQRDAAKVPRFAKSVRLIPRGGTNGYEWPRVAQDT